MTIDTAPADAPTVIVVMGVAGSGKSTVGRLLAERLNAAFEEGDAYHSVANVEKMRTGTPLSDIDRQPWLEDLARRIRQWSQENRRTVLACSALKKRFRETLLGDREGVALVYLKGTEKLIRSRLEARRGHYMPVELLTSQFAALEEPSSAITVDIRPEAPLIVDKISFELTKPRTTS